MNIGGEPTPEEKSVKTFEIKENPYVKEFNDQEREKRELEEKERKEQARREYYVLAIELSQRPESFPSPEIDPVSYSRIKADQEELPDYAVPKDIDEFLERCKTEGVKVVLGKHPESGNIFILPKNSNDIENDSILPKCLNVTDGMDENLKKLILMAKERV